MDSKRKRGNFVPVLLASLFVVTFVLVIVGVQGKYVTSVPLPGTVIIRGELADSVTLTEHKASRNLDGSYSLSAEATTRTNTYIVMPGVDIPKDPFFTINNKSSVPAYLYVEIVDNSPGTVAYSLTAEWSDLGITGPNYGKVYVFTGSLSSDPGDPTQTIPILKDNRVLISEKFDPSSTDFDLKFYGYMAQKQGEETAVDCFNRNF